MRVSKEFLISMKIKSKSSDTAMICFCVVEPGRFELPSKRAILQLSTCLVFIWIFEDLPVENYQRIP